MNFRIRLAVLTAPLLILCACNAKPYNHIDTPDPAFGEAVKYDMAVQVIDPDPVYDPQGAQPGDNGEVAAKAVQRYRSGQNNNQHNREARQGSAISTTGNSGNSGSPPQ